MGLLLVQEINILLGIEVRMEAEFGEAFSAQKTLAQQLAKGSATADFGLILHVGVGIKVDVSHCLPAIGIEHAAHCGVSAIVRATQQHHARALAQQLTQPLPDVGVVATVVGRAQVEVTGLGDAQDG